MSNSRSNEPGTIKLFNTDGTPARDVVQYVTTTNKVESPAAGGFIPAGASGTVSTISVASANGLAGTVANPTTTPAITLSTSITGLLKGNGTAISAATANTDYQSALTLTTTGSGAATLTGGALNIPTPGASSGTQGLAGDAINLKGSSAGAVLTAAWTASELIVETALGGTPVKLSNVSLSYNGATNGANGMDTGSQPVSGNLYIYAIYNGTTVAALGTTQGGGSPIYSGANMPGGYTYSALIWSGVTDPINSGNTNNFSPFIQFGHKVDTSVQTVANNTGVASLTSQTLVGTISPNTKTVSGVLTQPQLTGTAQKLVVSSVSSNGGIGEQYSFIYGTTGITGNTTALEFKDVPLVTASTIYWMANNTAPTAVLRISGYTF